MCEKSWFFIKYFYTDKSINKLHRSCLQLLLQLRKLSRKFPGLFKLSYTVWLIYMHVLIWFIDQFIVSCIWLWRTKPFKILKRSLTTRLLYLKLLDYQESLVSHPDCLDRGQDWKRYAPRSQMENSAWKMCCTRKFISSVAKHPNEKDWN